MKNKILIILLFPILTFSQEKFLKNIEEVKDLSNKTSQLFYQTKIRESFDMMELYWPIEKNELISLEENTLKYINILDDRFGAKEGIVKLKEEKIMDFAFKETFIIKFKNHAIRLIYIYYKNNEGWILNSFKWDDSFMDEFKEVTK